MTSDERRVVPAALLIIGAILLKMVGAITTPVGFWLGVAMLAVALLLLRRWVRCRARRRRRCGTIRNVRWP